MWRRVDAACLGRVGYDDVASAFNLSDTRSVGQPPEPYPPPEGMVVVYMGTSPIRKPIRHALRRCHPTP